MVFKRRDRRPLWRVALEFLWPRGGWGRASHYLLHRLRRLPDPPHRIARGVAAGVFVVFSPFFGLHFVFAAVLARLMRGNILAALLATFAGNPLTYVPIAAVSLQTGHFLLGRGGVEDGEIRRSLLGKFRDAGGDLANNLLAPFTGRVADWTGLQVFYDEVFLPCMVGGLAPGAVAGVAAYYLSLPIVRAYQNRRKGVLRAKWLALKEKARRRAEAGRGRD